MLSLMTFLPISTDRRFSEEAQAELEADKRVIGAFKNASFNIPSRALSQYDDRSGRLINILFCREIPNKSNEISRTTRKSRE